MIRGVGEGIETVFFKLFSLLVLCCVVEVGIGLKRLVSSEILTSDVLQDTRNSNIGIIKLCFN